MLQDRYYSHVHTSYPPKYKPPYNKKLIMEGRSIASSGGQRTTGAMPIGLKPLKSRSLAYVKYAIYACNVVGIISLAVLVPSFLSQANDVDEGRLIIPAEYRAEERTKKSDIDYLGLRTFGATRSRLIAAGASAAMAFSAILLILGTHYRSYCLTFMACLILMAPILVISLDIHWTYSAWFKILGISVNTVNCALAYAYSCLIKRQEYEELSLYH